MVSLQQLFHEDLHDLDLSHKNEIEFESTVLSIDVTEEHAIV